MTGRVRHVRREALPWQPPQPVTECGRRITDRMQVMSRGEWRNIARDLAEERAVWARAGVNATPTRKAPNVCGTCWATCQHHPGWDYDPLAVLNRAFEAAGPLRTLDGVRARAELKALADMMLADPGRFAELADRHERDYHALARPARGPRFNTAGAAGLAATLGKVL